ncbi:SagB family peptide dehydrogenase [Pseudomonas sp. NPDC088368]|jgi:SagB-type dehydrogenase family enzyme|uniref:SagB family peptide dehydrogenase n=1 Tax=Pseudomonas sp. NPDC088368 TaxID=3364453 RepID=UPI0037F5C6E6
MELINAPGIFEASNPIDRDFLATGILIDRDVPTDDWGWDILSKLFHVGTKNIPFEFQPETLAEWAKAYTTHCCETLSKTSPQENSALHATTSIDLPKPQPNQTRLNHALQARQTSREFNRKAVSLESVATILYYTLAYLDRKEDPDEAVLHPRFGNRRSSPSGGALNATEGYVYVTNVESVTAGVYYYNPTHHTLEHRSELPVVPLGNMLNGQHFVNDISFGVFFTSRLDKLWWKYEHSRAYRMALIEIGHLSQTFQLVATSFGLRTWLTGALNEKPIEQLINSPFEREEVMFFVGAGYGSNASVPSVLKAELARQIKDE